MTDSMSSTGSEMDSDGFGSSGDDGPPELDSSAASDVFESYDVTVSQTLVEDTATGTEFVQWEAVCGDERVISDSVMDAVMGALTRANGGELP